MQPIVCSDLLSILPGYRHQVRNQNKTLLGDRRIHIDNLLSIPLGGWHQVKKRDNMFPVDTKETIPTN